MSELNRHGNNFHPDLPECHHCKRWAWMGNDVHMGHGIEACYSCGTIDCNGRAIAVFFAVGMLAMFEAPLVDGRYRIPTRVNDWLTNTKRLLQQASINDCIHAGKEPPLSIVTDAVPALEHAQMYVGLDEWILVDAGRSVDLGGMFRQRVMECRRAYA